MQEGEHDIVSKSRHALAQAVYERAWDRALIAVILGESPESLDGGHRYRYGRSVLNAAIADGRCDVVAALLKLGADFEIEDVILGRTMRPLHHALQHGDAASAIALVNAGADINCRGEDGRTPLMAAAMAGLPSVVKLLLERGADISALDNLGNSALHLAAESYSYSYNWPDYKAVVRQLIAGGFDPELPNGCGRTARLVAKESGSHALNALLEHTAGAGRGARD